MAYPFKLIKGRFKGLQRGRIIGSGIGVRDAAAERAPIATTLANGAPSKPPDSMACLWYGALKGVSYVKLARSVCERGQEVFKSCTDSPLVLDSLVPVFG